MEQCYWHGNDAWVIDKEDGCYTILVGSYTREEAETIAEGLANDDSDMWDKYGDYVVYAEQEEYDEQQQ